MSLLVLCLVSVFTYVPMFRCLKLTSIPLTGFVAPTILMEAVSGVQQVLVSDKTTTHVTTFN